MIPIPSAVTQAAIEFLQKGSTEAVNVLFYLLGVPATREGFVFHLPGLSIEVAENCSGIRSSIALVITSVIAGKLFLRRGWQGVLLAISIVPIAILKNGIRIVSLSVIGTFLDERILLGDLHRKGGLFSLSFPFFSLWAVMFAEKNRSITRSGEVRTMGRKQHGE